MMRFLLTGLMYCVLQRIERPTGRRCNAPLWLLTGQHARMRWRFVISLPLAVLIDGSQSPGLAQSTVSLFGGAVPGIPVYSSSTAITLGVKFWSSQPGTISGIRFYRGAPSPNGYVAR